MTLKLMCHLSMFRGPKTRVRCFLHVVNLVAKLIVRQFDGGKAGEALDELEDSIEDFGDDEGVDDELTEFSDDDAEGEKSVEPVRMVIKKVSA